MSAKLRRSLMLAVLTVSLGLAGTLVPASGVTGAASALPGAGATGAGATGATEPPPTPPQSCAINVLIVQNVDPCLIVGSLQELAAFAAEGLGMNALKNVNLINVCFRPVHKQTPPPPASIINGCPILGE